MVYIASEILAHLSVLGMGKFVSRVCMLCVNDLDYSTTFKIIS